jgi:ribosomal protein S18 acetylase RimI-like enzyme
MSSPSPSSALTFRPALPSDYEHYLRLFPELGVSDPPPLLSRWLEEHLDGSSVLCLGPEVVGYTMVREYPPDAFVVNLIVSREHQHEGLGRELMERLSARLRERGFVRWRLHVKTDNEPALRLYRRMGLEVHSRSDWLELPVTGLGNVATSPNPVFLMPSLEGSDARFEELFDLLPGTLHRMRRGGSSVLKVTSPRVGEELGLVVHSKELRRSVVFRLRDAEYLRSALQALLNLDPSSAQLGLVVADPDVNWCLRNAGAIVRLETYQMRGDIPQGPTARRASR